MRKLVLALGVTLLTLSANAHAHFGLTNPPSTSGDPNGKGNPPCGPDAAAAKPMAVTGGSVLNVDVDETVAHTGFYRIALAINSRSELPVDNVVTDSTGKVLPPTGMPKGTSSAAAYEDPPAFPVLADHLWVHEGTVPQSFHTELTLPNVTCAKCTLQVIEFMADHPFNTSTPGPGGGYFYHHCADLKITADPALPPFGSGGAGGAGGSSGAGGAGASGASGAGTGGNSDGATGTSAGSGGSGGTSGAPGEVAGSAGAATLGGTTAGSSGSAGFSPSLSGAGTTEPSSSSDNSTGCSFRARSPAAKPELAVLLGLLLFRRRRRARSLRR